MHLSPRQEGSGDPSPENVREITGWNDVEGYGCGKNLFDSSKIIDKARLNQYGELLGNVEDVVSDYIKVQPSKTYTVSGFGILIFNERHCWYDKDKNYLKASTNMSSDVCTLTVPSDAEYVRLTIKNDCIESTQIELGLQATSYEPYQVTTTSINWTEDVGTVYGGYVDLVSGELVQTHYLAEITTTGLTSQNTNYDTTEDSIYFIIKNSFPQMLSNNSNGKDRTYSSEVGILPVDCKVNYLKPDYIDNWRGTRYVNTIVRAYVPPNFSVRMARDLIGVTSEDSETIKAQKINNYLTEHPLQVYYKLETPIHYQLTPQQLTALRGTNTIYSNTNGQTEIKYWKH